MIKFWCINIFIFYQWLHTSINRWNERIRKNCPWWTIATSGSCVIECNCSWRNRIFPNRRMIIRLILWMRMKQMANHQPFGFMPRQRKEAMRRTELPYPCTVQYGSSISQSFFVARVAMNLHLRYSLWVASVVSTVRMKVVNLTKK